MLYQDRIPIPMTFGEVNAEWITAVFAQHHPGICAQTVAQVDEMIGACVKLRIAIDWNAAGRSAALPSTVIVKGNFGRQGPELDFMFEDEMRSYRDVLSQMNLNVPACYHAGGRGGRTILVLEDLATPDCTFGTVARPLSFTEATLVLDQLAALHARYWDDSELADHGSLAWISQSLSTDHFAFICRILEPDRWRHYLELPRGVAAPRATAGDPARLLSAFLAQQAFHRTAPQTLCHGDAHGANNYFNRNGGGLFDWALRRAPWFYDISYFIAGTLDVVDRRNWEWALLQYYLGRLNALGVTPPSFEEAVYAYRRELIYGYVLMIGNGEIDAYWNEAANTAAATRFAMAAEDHAMLAAIESGE